MGSRLWAAVFLRIRVIVHLVLLTLVFSDCFREKSGIFWETSSLKPKNFREFLEFWVGPFELKLREFLASWLSRIFPKISGNLWGC